MKFDTNTICWILAAITFSGTVWMIINHFRKNTKEADELALLWETGATLLLSKVWGLINDAPPGEMPVIGEPAQITREKILRHIWKSDRQDKSFEHEVCGEKVSLLLQYPNTLFGFVDKQETLDAITRAHALATTEEQQLCIGMFPLILDIRVTDPEAH
ncbi:MAG: hypothetical protein JWP09_460 [Candidatus Taylorbacteria bacterium]|nr:hypothetical protein [Candidatus Taylorbacteria bacterium]